ncbi:MAG: SAM-dependent methyltransferase [Kiritimatiellae bacterium]|nr:SAM-dependent methyltransferase [Kiritimatiellia bacterium]
MDNGRFVLDGALADEIRSGVMGDGFMKLVQSVRRNGKTFKIAMRPVEIGGLRKFQAEMTDDGQVQVKNFGADDASAGLEEIIAQKGARDLHLMTAKGDLHVRVTKKGHVLVSRSAAMERKVSVKPHDRVKNLPLTSFDSAALLRVTGLADGEGRIRASMRGKYDQVNEFLKVVKETVDAAKGGGTGPFTVVDCGCGKAYLTLSLYFYLTRTLGFKDVKVYGVDRRADVVASAREMAKRLDAEDRVVFAESDLADWKPGFERADMVISLHACDTATDEAIARGVEWKAKYILSALCCQHELQKRLAELGGRSEGPAADFGGLLRQSILRERLCDILTDSFRAMILRILGFRTQVIEFVSSEATARNILLKGEWGVKPGQPGPVSEYLNLRDYWKVTPWLETRLEKLLERHFSRFDESK